MAAHTVSKTTLPTSEKQSRKATRFSKEYIKGYTYREVPVQKQNFKRSRKRSKSALRLESEETEQSKVLRLGPSAMFLRSEDMFFRSQELKMNVIDEVFSSISSLDETLKSINVITPLPLLRLFSYTETDLSRLSFLKKISDDTIIHGWKEMTSFREGTSCLEVVVFGLEDENHAISRTSKLSPKDMAVLKCFKRKFSSLQSSIFVFQTESKDVDLHKIAKEIAMELQENEKGIFKLVFHSKDRKIDERVEACLNNSFTTWMERQIKTERLTDEQMKVLLNEISKRKDMLPLHQIKTVALRNASVSGFGCIEKRLCVYLKQNDPKDEKSVREYLKEFCCTPPDGFELIIEHKNRKIKEFTKLEQGSKIQKTRRSEQSQQKYGSVGMFLSDKNGTYFMTTCAHVIGENAYAYSPTDSSRLGQSILTLTHDSEKEEGGSNGPWMDFSLVKISPEREIICQLGLKTTTTSHDHFINGKIFRGDVSNIRDHKVYKWGATEPNLRKARCLGIDEDGESQMFFLVVDSPTFAEEGDSGSIVCVGEDIHVGQAVFVLVGADLDENIDIRYGPIYRYHVFRVQDALEKVATLKESMTPCLTPRTCTIPISSQ